MTKRCPKCNELKDIEEFAQHGPCKECHNKYSREQNRIRKGRQAKIDSAQTDKLIASVRYHLDRNCPRRASQAMCQAKARMPDSGLPRLNALDKEIQEQLKAKRKELME